MKYSPPDQRRVLMLLSTLGLVRSDESHYALLRQNRGALRRRTRGGPAVVVAEVCGDWIG